MSSRVRRVIAAAIVLAATACAESRAQVAAPAAECAAAESDWKLTAQRDTLAAYQRHLVLFHTCATARQARERIAALSSQAPGGPAATAAQPSTPQAAPASACNGAATASLVASPPAVPPCPLSAADERALAPRQVFKECDRCPEMVVVPAGTFMMGTPASEPGHLASEEPQHPVTISRQFAVGRFHVTVDQFAAFVGETGYRAGAKCWTVENGGVSERTGRSWRNPGFVQATSHPAVCLAWADARAYVDWLARKTGKDYRLLSEAEWEYAARAGTTTRYSYGEDEAEMCRYGNGADQTARRHLEGLAKWTYFSCTDGYAHTSPVGHFLPNPFGLYDMHGNAWQWVEDCWRPTFAGAPANGSAWTAGECSRRVLRGGSFLNAPSDMRSGNRLSYPGDRRYFNNGFRVARTVGP